MQKQLLTIFFLMVGVSWGQANDTLLIYPEDKNLFIQSRFLDILEDPSGQLTIADVQQKHATGEFFTKQERYPLVEDIYSVYWLSFSCKFSEIPTHHWLFEVSDLHINFVEVYIRKGGQMYSLNQTGYYEDFHKRTYQHKNFIFDIPGTYNDDVMTFYLRIKSETHTPFIFKLRRNDFFMQYALYEYYILGIYYGILLIMALYNAILFLYVRENLYLYYVMYVGSCILASFAEDGLGFQLFWPDMPWLNSWVDRYAQFFFLFSFIVYTQTFLNFKRHLPLVYNVLWASVVVYSIYMFVGELFPKVYHPNAYVYLIGLPFLCIYGGALHLYLRGIRAYAGFFLLGYSFTMVGIVNLLLRKNGIIWDNIFFVYSLNIGFVLEVFFFSQAQAFRHREIKNAKERAQEELIEQYQKNERIIQQEVILRTEEINEQKSIIERQNQELMAQSEAMQQQSEEIQRMNLILNRENEQLYSNVQELTKARVLMQEVDFQEFCKIFPTEDACYEYLTEIKWQKGYACSRCKNTTHTPGRGRYAKRCTKCGYNESCTVNTIFERSHIDIQKAFYMVFMVHTKKESVSAVELSKILSLRENTCGKFIRKIRGRMKAAKNHTHLQGQDSWSRIILDD